MNSHSPAPLPPAPPFAPLAAGPAPALAAAALSIALAACGGSGGSAPAPAPSALALPNLADAAAATLTAGEEATPIAFANSGGGMIAACDVSPALPAALAASRTADGASCRIAGRPAAASAQASYTVTARNAAGADASPATVSITVRAAAPALAPPDLADAAVSGVAGEAIAPVDLANSGGGSLLADGATPDPGCLAAGLPRGLAAARTADGDSCRVSGIPAAAGDTTATVTARNAAGPDATPAMVAVSISAPPTAPDLTGGAATFTAGVRGAFALANAGTPPRTSAGGCAVTSGALPTGLAVERHDPGGGARATCRVIGAATAPAAATATATVTATDGSGATGAAVVTVTVRARPAPPGACVQDSAWRAPDDSAHPLAVSGVSRRLHLLGGHADGADAEFILRYTGTDGGGGHVYQLGALIDATGAAPGYTGREAALRIAGDDGETELTPTTPGEIPTDGTAVPVSLAAGAGSPITLALGSAYLFTLALGSESPAAGPGAGTLSVAACADSSAPTLAAGQGAAYGASAAAAAVRLSVAGGAARVRAVALPASDPAPDAAAIDAHASAVTAIPAADGDIVIYLRAPAGLVPGTDYTLYAFAEDSAGNRSDVATAAFTTASGAPDADPPEVSASSPPALGSIAAASAELSVTASEPGELVAVALPDPAGGPAPGRPADIDALEALAGAVRADIPAPAGGALTTAGVAALSGLSPGTAYRVFFALRDVAGNATGVMPMDGIELETLPPAPALEAPPAQSVTVGEPLGLTIRNTVAGARLSADDADPPGCAASPALPAGLSIAVADDGLSCEIAGSPTATTSGPAVFMVTANGGGGSSTVSLALDVTPIEAHASISVLRPATADHPAGYGEALEIFADAAAAPYTLGADGGTARVIPAIDTARGQVIELATGSDADALAALTAPAPQDLGAYAGGLLQLDVRVSDAPDDALASWTLSARTGEPAADTAPAALGALPLSEWVTVRADLSLAPWSGADWGRALRPLALGIGGGRAAEATIAIDRVLLLPADSAAPTASVGAVVATDSAAAVPVTSTEAGAVHVLVLPAADPAPAPAAVESPAAGALAGMAAAEAGSAAEVRVAGLAPSTMYIAHAIATDIAGNASAVASSAAFATGAALVAPVLASPAPATLERGEATGLPIAIPNSGGRALNALNHPTAPGCALASGALPTGLSLERAPDGSTCRIAGRPTVETTAAVTVMVTATNAAGTSPAVAVSITVADTLAPVLLFASTDPVADITATTATANLTASEAGTVYVAALPASNTDTVTLATIKQAVDDGDDGAARVMATGTGPVSAPISGLDASTSYVAHAAMEDSAAAPNPSAVVMSAFATTNVLDQSIPLEDVEGIFYMVVGSAYADPHDDATAEAARGASVGWEEDANTFAIEGCTLATVDGAAADPADPDLRLPAGLALGQGMSENDCVITGTPTAYAPARTYGIRATGRSPNQAMGGTGSVRLKAATQATPDFDTPRPVLIEGGLNYTVADGTAIRLSNRGGAPAICVWAASFLSIPQMSISKSADGETCILTGTTTASTGAGNTGTFAIDVTGAPGNAGVVFGLRYVALPNPTQVPLAASPEARLRTILIGDTGFGAGGPGSSYYEGGRASNLAVKFETGTGFVGAVTRCRLDNASPALPAFLGLEISSRYNSCVVSHAGGDRETWTASPPTDYAVIGSNWRGDSIAAGSIRIEVATGGFTAPALDNVAFPAAADGGSADTVTLGKDTAIVVPIAIPNGGSKLSATWRWGCNVTSSNLPTGLEVRLATAADASANTDIEEGETCVIAGTPTAAAAAAMVTVSYPTDHERATASYTFSLSVTDNSPDLTPSGLPGQAMPVYRYEIGRSYPEERGISFTNAGAAITGCSVANADLPDGMSIDTGSCAITGAPTRLTAETTTHTVTASGAVGMDEVEIAIETHHIRPPDISGFATEKLNLVGLPTSAFPILVPSAGGSVERCVAASSELQPGFPQNRNIRYAVASDGGACEIGLIDPLVGVTAVASDATTVNLGLVATNDLGISVAEINVFGPTQDAPSSLAVEDAQRGSSFSLPANVPITPIAFARAGEGLCSAAPKEGGGPPLPEGLSVDRATCEIFGAPRQAIPETAYVLTLTHGDDTATAEISVTVTDSLPALEASSAASLTQGSSIGLPVIVAATAGLPASCTAAVPASAGAQGSLSDYNLFLYATPAGCAIDSVDGQGPAPATDGMDYELSYEISASNATGPAASASDLTLAVRAPKAPVLSAHFEVACAISATGRLYCWGNAFAILGFGFAAPPLDAINPIQVGDDADWADVSAGYLHFCAVKEGGTLYCGGIRTPALGFPTSSKIPHYALQQVGVHMDAAAGLSTGWSQVSAGGSLITKFSCGIKDSGHLYCWGETANGVLGLGAEGSAIPERVGTNAGWASVTTGYTHACAINDGALHCWGSGVDGSLGLGNEDIKNTPQQVGVHEGAAAGLATGWTQVSAGSAATCAVKQSGTLYCWGKGNFGQVGVGNNDNQTLPQQVGVHEGAAAGLATGWTQVSIGEDHACGIKDGGQLYCWGTNDSGQLGLSGSNSRTSPTRVGVGQDYAEGWVSVSAAENFTCGRRLVSGDHQLLCWGKGDSGQLGIGSEDNTNVPTEVPFANH